MRGGVLWGGSEGWCFVGGVAFWGGGGSGGWCFVGGGVVFCGWGGVLWWEVVRMKCE